MVIGRQLTPHNGLDPHFFGCLKKKDECVQSIGVGQSESVHPLLLGGAAEFFNGGDTPTLGIMRMDIEMDKISHDISPPAAAEAPRLSARDKMAGQAEAHQGE
jgi:hypothetical protein